MARYSHLLVAGEIANLFRPMEHKEINRTPLEGVTHSGTLKTMFGDGTDIASVAAVYAYVGALTDLAFTRNGRPDHAFMARMKRQLVGHYQALCNQRDGLPTENGSLE